ncbi:MAG: hypothetical protein WC471_00015 [Candidatus Woesearchaeota archaeon]
MIQKPVNSKETKQIFSLVENQWGFKPDFGYQFLKCNDKLHIVSRDIRNIDLGKLRINSIGLYVAELKNNQVRLTVEGSQLIGPYATKNVVDLPKDQLKLWLRGEEVPCNEGDGFVIVKHNNDYFGCGKIKEGRIINYLPKTRRLNAIPDSQ